jgi:hypothetical protein
VDADDRGAGTGGFRRPRGVSDLSDAALEQLKIRVLDTVGVAIGALDAPPIQSFRMSSSPPYPPHARTISQACADCLSAVPAHHHRIKLMHCRVKPGNDPG